MRMGACSWYDDGDRHRSGSAVQVLNEPFSGMKVARSPNIDQYSVLSVRLGVYEGRWFCAVEESGPVIIGTARPSKWSSAIPI